MNTEVFGISVDSYASLNKYRQELGLQFDLLSDWNRETSKKYSAYNSKEGVANRKSFLVDKKGIVRFLQQSGLEEARNHAKMLEAVRILYKENGNKELITSDSSETVVEAVFYEFYSETCSHCQQMKPIIEEFRKRHENKFQKFLLVPFKGSDNISLFHEYFVSGTPTFIITDKEGKEIDRITGMHTLEVLEKFMKSSLERIKE